MKENRALENFINWLKTDFEYNSGEEIKAIEHILRDYKRVLKENKILKEEKEQAWEEWNNLEQGSYETEQKLKQQMKELLIENEELKQRIREHTLLISPYYVKENFITVQIIKDFIKKYQKLGDKFYEKFLETNRTDKDLHDVGLACDAKVQVLQELLEKEKIK